MIKAVTFEKTTFAALPAKFEAGTPNIAGVIGLGAAVDYVQALGLTAIAQHEAQLLAYAVKRLSTVPSIRFIGQATLRASVVSFILPTVHPHDVATILDQYGVAVRAGHHCAMPVMTFFKVPATVRVSIGLYNTESDIDQCVTALLKAQALFQ